MLTVVYRSKNKIIIFKDFIKNKIISQLLLYDPKRGTKKHKKCKVPNNNIDFIDQQMANGQGGSSNICTCQPTREIRYQSF